MNATVPETVAELVLRRAPWVLDNLVFAAGGRPEAQAAAGVSRNTLARWMESNPDLDGDLVWAYPHALTVLDRLFRMAVDEGFVSWVERTDPAWWTSWQRGDPVGLGVLGLPIQELMAGARVAGISAQTARRWMTAIPYPSSWRSLDRLAVVVGPKDWLTAVRWADPASTPARIPRGAMNCLVEILFG